MNVLLARYEVTDPDRFLAVFDGFEAARREHGSTGHRVLSDTAEPGRVVVTIDFASREEAEGFAASREREAALREASAVSRQDEILELVRSAQAPGDARA
jgi:heme-degrading monooxygenase HmoA